MLANKKQTGNFCSVEIMAIAQIANSSTKHLVILDFLTYMEIFWSCFVYACAYSIFA